MKDLHRIAVAIDAAEGETVVVRAAQTPGGKREVKTGTKELGEAFVSSGIDLSLPFDLEIVIRNPLAQQDLAAALNGKRNYIDQSDYNALQWAGDRSTGTVQEHPIRNSPMFFRDNGMNVDLVDLFRGSTVFLILNGPSFAKVDKGLLRRPGVFTFGINNGGHGFRPDFWTCVDDPTRFMESIWKDPKITKFVPMAHFRKPIWDTAADSVSGTLVADFPNVIGFRRNEKFDAAQWLYEDTINWGNHGDRGGGRSVMLSALKICFLLGFRRVNLVGCDFRMDSENGYWFDEERSDNAVKNNTRSYQIMQGYFRELLPRFGKAGFEVVNCTPGSGLEVFPSASLEDAVRDATVDTSSPTRGMYVNRYRNGPKGKDRPTGRKVGSVPTDSGGGSAVRDHAVRDHVVEAIRNAEADSDPFHHLVIRQVFPEPLYRAVHEHLPPPEFYEDLRHRDAMKDDGSSSRLHLILSEESLARLPGGIGSFWRPIYRALVSEQVKEAVFARHRPALLDRFGKSPDTLGVRPRISLIRDLAGYRIGIHRDIAEKVVTTQFYLPKDGSQHHLGTSFYRGSPKTETGAKYEFARRMEFLPNAGYSFTVSRDSYHGVDTLSGADAPRDSLMFVYYSR